MMPKEGGCGGGPDGLWASPLKNISRLDCICVHKYVVAFLCSLMKVEKIIHQTNMEQKKQSVINNN